MWSLTSQRTSRISGLRNFRSLVKKDFFNTIDVPHFHDLIHHDEVALAKAPPLLWDDYATGKVN